MPLLRYLGRLAEWLSSSARIDSLVLPEMATIEVVVEGCLLLARLPSSDARRGILRDDAPWRRILCFVVGVGLPRIANPHWRMKLAEVLLTCFTEGAQQLAGKHDEDLLVAMEDVAPVGPLEHLLSLSYSEIACSQSQSSNSTTNSGDSQRLSIALAEDLLKLFCAVERTGAAGQFYEKFHQRYLLAILIRTLWAHNADFTRRIALLAEQAVIKSASNASIADLLFIQ